MTIKPCLVCPHVDKKIISSWRFEVCFTVSVEEITIYNNLISSMLDAVFLWLFFLLWHRRIHPTYKGLISSDQRNRHQWAQQQTYLNHWEKCGGQFRRLEPVAHNKASLYICAVQTVLNENWELRNRMSVDSPNSKSLPQAPRSRLIQLWSHPTRQSALLNTLWSKHSHNHFPTLTHTLKHKPLVPSG